MTSLDRFREAAQQFVDGDDSINAANRIEGVLLQDFDDTALYESLSYALAAYAPGHGREYVNADELSKLLRTALATLTRLPTPPQPSSRKPASVGPR